MYSQFFPYNLLNLRPELFLQAQQAGLRSGLVGDLNDNTAEEEEEEEEEIDDDETGVEAQEADPEASEADLNTSEAGVEAPEASPRRVRISDVSKKPKLYTDNLNEMCLVKCKICERTLSHGSLRDHLLRAHNKKRQEFVTYEYAKLTYYRCKICNAETLFTHAAVSQHVRVYHNLTFSQYKINFNGFTGEIDKPSKSSADAKVPTVPSSNNSVVKEISFDNSLLAEHSLDTFLPKSNSLLEHLLRLKKMENTASDPASIEGEEEEEEVEEEGEEEQEDISPLEFCDANLTDDNLTSRTGEGGEGGEDEDGYSDIDCDPNMFCEMSMAESNEEGFMEDEEDLENNSGDSNSLSILPVIPSVQDEREDGEVRIVTDNLNEMCEFECLLCGYTLVESTLSKHLKEVHQESRREGITHKYKRLTYYKCKICSKEITFYFAALREHMVTRHNMKMPEYRARFKAFSNQHIVTDNINEMCLCRCNICEQTFLHHKVKKHMKYKHNTNMKNLYTFIRQTYYRCKICLSEVLFSLDSIRNHLWNHHTLSMQDYKNSCQAFTGEGCEVEENSSNTSETPSNNSSASSSAPAFASSALNNSLDMSRVLPPLPRLKNFSHLVNQDNQFLPFIPGNPGSLNPALNPFNISKEQIAYFLMANSKTFSDKLSEMSLCKCKICDEEVLHHLLKKHMKSKHSCNLTKSQYEYVRETYYRCKICDSALLFSFESIRRHVYQAHKLSLKEYRAKHAAFEEETSPEGIPEQEKIFSDDPKDMCICACKVCGDEHLHHLIMKHIRKKHGVSSKDNYQFTKLIYYKCKVCETDFPFSMLNISNHLIQNHKLTMTEYKRQYPAFSGVEMLPPPPKEEEREKIFTDNLDERCICRCNVCGKEMYQDRLGKHSELNHKSKPGSGGRNEFVLKTYHRCRVCESELLFNLQGIRKHVRRAHNMSMDEYKVTYSPFTGGKGIRKGRPSKKKTLKEMKLKKKRKVEEGERYMFHAMDDNELENKADEEEEEEEEEDHEDPDFDPNKTKRR